MNIADKIQGKQDYMIEVRGDLKAVARSRSPRSPHDLNSDMIMSV